MFDFGVRTTAILGEENMDILMNSTVAVVGIGGVGSACAESLCRCGVGNLILIDNDTVSLSNCNRQLIATQDKLDTDKTAVAYERYKNINPQCNIKVFKENYTPENSDFLFDLKPDVIVDAIDTVTSKLHLIVTAKEKNIQIFSSMGTGNRLDPSKLCYGDIKDTIGNGCNFSRIMRKELNKRGVSSLNIVYSKEPAIKGVCTDSQNGRHSPGSSPFVPPVAGFLLGYKTIDYLINKKTEME